jgi:hypothetical protein
MLVKAVDRIVNVLQVVLFFVGMPSKQQATVEFRWSVLSFLFLLQRGIHPNYFFYVTTLPWMHWRFTSAVRTPNR